MNSARVLPGPLNCLGQMQKEKLNLDPKLQVGCQSSEGPC